LITNKEKHAPRYPQLCTKRKKKKRKIFKKKRKVERSYRIRYWVHLNYHLLKMVLWEVEGASATAPHLMTQDTYSDAVKARRNLSNI